MPPLNDAAHEKLLDQLIRTVDELDFTLAGREIASRVDMTPQEAADELRKYCNEGVATLRVVGSRIEGRNRILEVGSGIGFVANFLAGQGYEVVELEPIGLGFTFFEVAREVLAEMTPRPAVHLDMSVDDLDPDVHGRFDLVYSLNVIEHVPDWRHALGRIVSVLEPGASAVQSCPNYSVPYEPHFGVPLVPGAPASTARLLPSRITETDLWKSLNWITIRQLRRWAREQGVELTFVQGQLSEALARLSSDPEFRERHSAWMVGAAKLLDRVGALRLLRRLPPSFNTPMQFELRRG